MDPVYSIICARLGYALLAGGVIGLERSYHGRSAGFRTHTLVCLASCLLMLLTYFEQEWLPASSRDFTQLDPTRMAQGIMTGIGFLGAGVIFKEGLSVRGLTTAASIWITAAIGVLVGVGFLFPATAATLLTLAVLSLFRLIEVKMPTHWYASAHLRFARGQALTEAELKALLKEQGFKVTSLAYAVTGPAFEYRLTLRSDDRRNIPRLAEALRIMKAVKEFSLSPNSD
jgi:putative Mg2+ transporter-C (MgtC) family protein